jgi:transposase-like protein
MFDSARLVFIDETCTTTSMVRLPEREIMTGIGPVAVRCPRVRDRVGESSERIRFSSATKKAALGAFVSFVETWGVKYDKAVECLIKDRDALLAFYDFPAEH